MMAFPESSLEKVKEIARQALSGQIHMFLACVKISNETINLQNVPREITIVFDGVASEIDGLPIGDERQHWNPVALLEQDKEIERYLVDVGPVLKEAMEKLVAFA
jgi:hypothetical protein